MVLPEVPEGGEFQYIPEKIQIIAKEYPVISGLMGLESMSDDLVFGAELARLYHSAFDLLLDTFSQYEWGTLEEVSIVNSGGEYVMDENFSLVLVAIGYVREEVNDEEFDELLEVLTNGPLFSYLLAIHTMKRETEGEEFMSIYDIHVDENDAEFYDEYEDKVQGLSQEAQEDFYVGIFLRDSLMELGETVRMKDETEEIIYQYGRANPDEVVKPRPKDPAYRFVGPVTAGEMYEASKPLGHILN